MAGTATMTATKWRLTDEQSAMVDANRGLVHSYVGRRFGGRHPLADELIQVGMLGLMQAVVNYDPGRGVRLSTYAQYWINQAIERSLWTDGVIRRPAHAKYNPGCVAAAERAGSVGSLDLRNEKDSLIGEPQANCDHEKEVEDDEEKKFVHVLLAVAMRGLSPTERDIVKSRQLRGEAYKAIADRYGWTRERPRQIEREALRKMRDTLKRVGFEWEAG